MSREPEFLTPAEAEAAADDINCDRHWGAAPLPCWCSVPHLPGAAGTAPPPWENEVPGAVHPSAPGSAVPAPASGAARAPEHRSSGPQRNSGAPPEALLPGGAAPLSPDPPSSGDRGAMSPLPGARSQPDAPGGGEAGEGFRAKWKAALAANAKDRRRQRGKHRAQPGYRPGMNRRDPG